mmetsp:Transcript_39713/g.114616  ORF Transcript_39713/g.114616 Transcript_39713/m.114616 type:complete len:227 (-) Transcript_39713:526-1206(-)
MRSSIGGLHCFHHDEGGVAQHRLKLDQANLPCQAAKLLLLPQAEASTAATTEGQTCTQALPEGGEHQRGTWLEHTGKLCEGDLRRRPTVKCRSGMHSCQRAGLQRQAAHVPADKPQGSGVAGIVGCSSFLCGICICLPEHGLGEIQRQQLSERQVRVRGEAPREEPGTARAIEQHGRLHPVWRSLHSSLEEILCKAVLFVWAREAVGLKGLTPPALVRKGNQWALK